ncbi:hypothetical protein GCM10020254_81630 [Streptomyces goshikiensis]
MACFQGVPVPAHDDDWAGGPGGHDQGHGSEQKVGEFPTSARADDNGVCRASLA